MHIFLGCAFFLGEASCLQSDSQSISRPRQAKKHWIQGTSGFQESRRVSLLILRLRCSECQESLTNWYYEKDGKLYCHKDYWRKFGEFCHGCSLLMTGPVMVSESLHPCSSWPSESTDRASRSRWPFIFWSLHQPRPLSSI